MNSIKEVTAKRSGKFYDKKLTTFTFLEMIKIILASRKMNCNGQNLERSCI